VNLKIDLSNFQKTSYAVAECGWHSDDRKSFGASDADVNNALGFVVRAVVPSGHKLFGTTRLSEIGRNDDANGIVLLALRFMNRGALNVRCISCGKKALPICIREVSKILALRGAGTVGES
jgi:hypothetical protein